ncbi:MAG: hypothetical protein IJV83_00690 [Clostridia bacterium]|nr:hypothetical protein [Clostridia bacterium]
MLDKHLIAHTRPYANEGNVVFWADYRVTVLGKRLFRLEKSERKIFRDKATQSVWFRDMAKTEFSVFYHGETAVIDTGVCRLILAKERRQVCVEFEDERVLATNEGNLLGTYRTLDNCNADVYSRPWLNEEPRKIWLEAGVCSKTGVAVLDDSASLSLSKNGEVENERADGSDEYIFAYGDDYRGAVRALYQITGAPPIVPRYALGNWWSRYHVYTDEEYLQVLNRFEERKIPLTVATVDMDWHYSEDVDAQLGISERGRSGKEYVGDCYVNLGWTGYTWNKNLFPDYKKFLKELGEKSLKITLNLHPSDGVRFWERDYVKMAAALGISEPNGKCIPFDFSNATFINAYFAVLHRPYEKDGVDFWWVDWQQPNIPWQSEKDNGAQRDYDPLWALNHYHYLDNLDGHREPLVLSRYAGVGSHRYPIGFSGDTEITWETLAYLPYFTATATNVGYTWWSHDIGGHNFGEKNDELYVRHIQYGVFSPINRLHCTSFDTMTKEPWEYGNGAGLIAAEFLRLRHQLIPYLYTASRRTHEEGAALIEPLYYRHKQAAAYQYPQEYYFGSELLVAPVVTPQKKDGYARVKIWLPEGRWTDIFTGDEYEAGKKGKEITLYRKLDEIPVLAKSGGVLPLSMDAGNGCGNPQKLEIRIYNGDGKYTLLEDGAEKNKTAVFKTVFTQKLIKEVKICKQITEIYGEGDGGIIPEKRVLRLCFANVKKGEFSLWIDGKKTKAKKIIGDCATIEIPFKKGTHYRVEVCFARQTHGEKLCRRALRVLTKAEANNSAKYAAWQEIKKAKTKKQFLNAVRGAKLPAVIKAILKETL